MRNYEEKRENYPEFGIIKNLCKLIQKKWMMKEEKNNPKIVKNNAEKNDDK